MDLHDTARTRFHLMGCGGVGMVGLGIILHERGFSVSGSDLKECYNTSLLRRRGIPVAIGHSPDNLRDPGPDLFVIRSSAVSDGNPEFSAAAKTGCPNAYRGEFLAELAASYHRTVAVAGSHGKTSVTSLIVHILKTCGRSPGFMIGGKVCGWDAPAAAGDGNIFVTESDESDGTLVHMRSHVAVVTNTEEDHSWTVGGDEVIYGNFAKFAENAETLLYYRGGIADEIFKRHPRKTALDCAAEEKRFSHVKNWGRFQRENAAIAARTAICLGVDESKAFAAAESFPGAERRMTVRFDRPGFTLVEDYAHHPTELAASIDALKERFPGRRLRVVFQPHRYARLKKYLDRLACELRRADEVYVTPVFAAWVEKGPVSSETLAETIGKSAKFAEADWPVLAHELASSVSEPEVLAVIGAGDIDEIFPYLKEELGRKG